MKNKLDQRRSFLKHFSIAGLGCLLGSQYLLAGNSRVADLPKLDLNHSSVLNLPEKHPGLVVLNDRPVNAETPPHLLDHKVTPNDVFFVRNNGIPPEKSTIDLKNWTLTIDGESANQKKIFSLDELKTKFKQYTYNLTLECGGNGRKEFNPPAKGNQWSTGAVGCAAWTGVRLKDVLAEAGIKKDAVYIAYYGKDTHLSGDPKKRPISRGVPISKAMENESLIAWSMNGQDLPWLNGYPLRLVIGGWPASCSGKWLERISIRNKVHDGPKMGGQAYRVPCKPVPPGAKVADKDMCIIESMPVKSLITYPKTGAMIQAGQSLSIRGQAWAGDLEVAEVFSSIDFGASWQKCILEKPVNRLAWQHFSAKVSFPQNGYYEIWAKAVDSQGRSQPMLLPGWNPKGYLNNACHRIVIKVG